MNSRGVYDDVCYLRQAHLFQRFGLNGIDTDIVRDDDRWLANKLKEIGYGEWNNPARAPCHTPMPASNKIVLQYPPGTGFVLAAFPEGFQVIPLFMLASLVAFGFALFALLGQPPSPWCARGRLRRCRRLSDDQPDQGELLDGADHDGLRAGGLSDRTVVCDRKRRATRLLMVALIGLLLGISPYLQACRTFFCRPVTVSSSLAHS